MIRNGLISLNLNRLCSPILGQRSQHIIESRFGLNGRICIFRRKLAGTAILLLQNIEYIPRFIFINRSANNDVLLYLVDISGKSFGLTHPFIGILLDVYKRQRWYWSNRKYLYERRPAQSLSRFQNRRRHDLHIPAKKIYLYSKPISYLSENRLR